MSEATTSGETSVAPVETPSAPPAAVPTFGNSRGSGLSRGKRPGASAPATKDAAPGGYQPTAIQVVNHQREYKNPFAPEPAPAAAETPAAKVEQPVVNTPAEHAAPATPAPAAEVESKTPAPQAAVEPKAELKILPPEEKARPAQSWEIGNNQPQPTTSTNTAPRREDRRDFRSERRERQDRGEGRSENRDQRGEFRPRERREQSDDQRREGGEQRREQRTFEPKPTPAQTEAKKSGFLGWLKGLFGGESTEQNEAKPDQRREERGGEGRREGGGHRHHHRGGRGRGGYRGDNRSENRGPQGEGQSQGGEQNQGDRRFDGHRGGGRRHHRGGRGRFRGEGRGGEHRSEGGPSSGNPAS